MKNPARPLQFWSQSIIVWLAGACAVAACFVMTVVALADEQPLRGLAFALPEAYANGALFKLAGTAASWLAAVALLGRWAWRRHRVLGYWPALGLSVGGFVLFWTISALLMARNMPMAYLDGLLTAWLAGVVLGGWGNTFNLLVVVPGIAWLWFGIAQRHAAAPDDGHTTRPGGALPPPRARRRALLAAAAVATGVLYVTNRRYTERPGPIDRIDFDIGGNIDATIEASGVPRFSDELDTDLAADTLVYVPIARIPPEAPVTFTRKGYEIRWSNVARFALYAGTQGSPDQRVHRALCTHESAFGSHEQARLAVQDTIDQFRRGKWVAVAAAEGAGDVIGPDAWLARVQRGTPLQWRWRGEGVAALLEVSALPSPAGDPRPRYGMTLAFSEAHSPTP